MNKTLLQLVLGALFLLPDLRAVEPPNFIPPPQLDVGDNIPNVILQDEESKPFSLRECVSRKPAVIVFYRGGWCPYCTRHLAALADIEKDLIAAGFQILAIGADQPSKIQETPQREKIHYQLISDHEMTAARAFGIAFKVDDALVAKYKDKYKIDLEASSGEKHHLLPHPSVFVVDTSGTIRFAHVNPDYKSRLDPVKILEVAKSSIEVKSPAN